MARYKDSAHPLGIFPAIHALKKLISPVLYYWALYLIRKPRRECRKAWHYLAITFPKPFLIKSGKWVICREKKSASTRFTYQLAYNCLLQVVIWVESRAGDCEVPLGLLCPFIETGPGDVCTAQCNPRQSITGYHNVSLMLMPSSNTHYQISQIDII